MSMTPRAGLHVAERLAAFIESYRASYNEYPTDWAINGYDAMMWYAAAATAAGTTDGDAIIAAFQSGSFDGLKATGLTMRAFDGKMNAPAYVGEVNFDPAYPFPTMKNVEKFAGEALMFSEGTIQTMRDAAK